MKDRKLDARQKGNIDKAPVNILSIITLVAVVLIAVCLAVLFWPSSKIEGPGGTEPTEATITETVAASTKETVHRHTWKDATCEEPQICKTCNEKKGSPLGHKWIEASYDTPKTCSICKITEGDVLINPIVEPIRDRLPIVMHAISSSERIYGFENSDLTEKSSEFYFEPHKDEIVITDVTKDGSALEIRYPSSIAAPGYRTLWFPTERIIPLGEVKVISGAANKKTITYRYSQDGSTLMYYGRMDPGDEYVSLGKTESGHKVVVYPIYRDTVCGLSVEEKMALLD